MNPLILVAMLVFPGGLFVLANGLFYSWVDGKLVARLQNRLGPRWFQPFADIVKLLVKEDVLPTDADRRLVDAIPVVALAGALTAALFVPIAGLQPLASMPGDLVIVVYALSLLTLCLGIVGMTSGSHYSILGATRVLTQLFAYEAPFLLALLGPAFAAGRWQISEVVATHGGQWLLLTQPIGFAVAVMSLMGKVELPPFDAPEAETELVAGSMTEYGGRRLALMLLAKKTVLVVALTLIATLYMGGIANPLDYVAKTLLLLLVMAVVQTLFTRFRIDQTIGFWWRYLVLLMLAQWCLLLLL